MKIEFPKNFIWGTSTAAYQIESASNHDWKGVKCKDGTIFDKCSMHDSHREEDLEYICQLSPWYRIGQNYNKRLLENLTLKPLKNTFNFSRT